MDYLSSFLDLAFVNLCLGEKYQLLAERAQIKPYKIYNFIRFTKLYTKSLFYIMPVVTCNKLRKKKYSQEVL